jgi:hypothetical protein
MSCDKFLTASRVRLRRAKRRAGGPDAGRGREVIQRGCVTEQGPPPGPKRGSWWGCCPTRGRRPMSRFLRAVALRVRRRRQAGLPRFP